MPQATAILLILFAISVLISQSLMDLFSTLLCLYLTFAWFKNRKELSPTPKMGFDWLWLTWLGVTALGFALNAPPPSETPPHFWFDRLVEFKWILILYFMLGGLRLTSVPQKATEWFGGAIFACSLYAIIDYFIELRQSPDLRLGGLFQFSMTYAHVYGVFFCALMGLFFYKYKDFPSLKKYLYALGLLVVGASILLTYTRGAWIAVIVSIVTMSLLWRIRNGLVSLLVCALVALSLYTLVPGVKNRVDFTAKMADAEQAKQSYDSERVILWKTNWMIFKDHPWFGTGYGQNKFYLHEYYEKQGLPKDQFIGHAHNQYIHLLAGTGILGLACYLGILGLIAWKTLLAYVKTPKDNHLNKGLALGALGGQIFFAIGSLTESNFEHSKVRFAIMWMWALGLWLWQETKISTSSPQRERI